MPKPFISIFHLIFFYQLTKILAMAHLRLDGVLFQDITVEAMLFGLRLLLFDSRRFR